MFIDTRSLKVAEGLHIMVSCKEPKQVDSFSYFWKIAKQSTKQQLTKELSSMISVAKLLACCYHC